MDKSDKPSLKIADTPSEDAEVAEPVLPVPSKPMRRAGRDHVQRLSPEEMDLEIERIQRAKGPTLAKDTLSDADDDG